MSIQSEVSRIDGAKGALKTAIEGKGVAVPEDTRIDGYATLVDEIQHGTGDMKASVYDPQNKAQDMFAYADGKAPLMVTFTADDAFEVFSSSHGAFEIIAAVESGRPVYGLFGRDVYTLTKVSTLAGGEIGQADFSKVSIEPGVGESITLSVVDNYQDAEHTQLITSVELYTDEIDTAGIEQALANHTGDTTVHVTEAERAAWNGKADKTYVDASVPDITGKADKAVPSAAGNVAALDASGNLADSGKKPADFAAAGHPHAADDITSGVVPVANGGTGTTTLTQGYALIGNGTNAVTLRAITDISSSVSTISISSNLITSRAITNILNRSDTIFSSNTNYATYMARGTSLNSAETTPTKNGTIAWTYE